MMEDAERAGRRDEVLEQLLPDIVFDGWSARALSRAASAAGVDSADLAALFPGGVGEARRWLDDWADRQMMARLAGQDLEALRLSERVALALVSRLEVLAPYREAVRLALAARFRPDEYVSAGRSAALTVDRIWKAVGDRSVDFSYYTKRASLAGIHVATMLYWLNDESPDFADTRDFIARRLADLGRIPSIRRQAEAALRPLTGPFEFLRRGAVR